MSGSEDSHHRPSDAMHNPSQPLKRVASLHLHSDEWKSFQCQRQIALRFQDDIKYEHVGPQTQDHKKAKYYKGRQVMMKDLKGKVIRERKRQRKDQDQDHKSMIGTKGASTPIRQERLKIKA
ncbi:hypothetical protein Tco_0459850 [Tanacetum coccineum]